MSNSRTNSASSAYTEARAKYVMEKVHEDLIGLSGRGIITLERANNIKEEVLYLLNKQVLIFFQLKFIDPKGNEIGGLHYKLFSKSYIASDQDSGDINYWCLSRDTHVQLFVSLDHKADNIDEVNKQLKKWSYGVGNPLEGAKEELKSYSKDGYGLKQIKIGKW